MGCNVSLPCASATVANSRHDTTNLVELSSEVEQPVPEIVVDRSSPVASPDAPPTPSYDGEDYRRASTSSFSSQWSSATLSASTILGAAAEVTENAKSMPLVCEDDRRASISSVSSELSSDTLSASGVLGATQEETDIAKSMDKDSLDLFLSVVNVGKSCRSRRGSRTLWANSTTPLTRRVHASFVDVDPKMTTPGV